MPIILKERPNGDNINQYITTMSGKTILTKEQFNEKSKSQCITFFPSNNLMVNFFRDQDGYYLVTMALFDDDYHVIVHGRTFVDYTLDEAYTMYLKLSNLQ